jgi:hypothetical protein
MNDLKTCEMYSLQCDESIDVADTAQLAVIEWSSVIIRRRKKIL